jgi:trimeric autotransporter adhesin
MNKTLAAFIVSCLLLLSGSAWAGLEGANTLYGIDAGHSIGGPTIGNSFFGGWAGYYNTAEDNTFIGHQAGYNNSSGYHNSFIGYQAGYSNTTHNNHSFVGYQAGYSNTLGENNCFVGAFAGYSNTIGSHNSIVGAEAGYDNTGGSYNSFLGRSAGHSNTTGTHNSFLGYWAGYSNTEGLKNSFIGSYAGGYNITGQGNVFLGYRAGFKETGSNKLYIDNCYIESGSGLCDMPLIYGAFENRMVGINGALTMTAVLTPSDIRLKKEIEPLKSSLEKVMNLKGVSYIWKADENQGRGFNADRNIGLIAQDVENIIPEVVHTDVNGFKALSYDKLVPVLVEAIKEQQDVIKELKGEMARMSAELNRIKNKDIAAQK